jgi:two-component system sensor histidine kinase KdpD
MKNSESSNTKKISIADKLYGGMYGYLFSLAMVLLACIILLWAGRHFDKSHAGLLFMMAVVFSANISGTRAAILAAVLSFLCWNFFFLPPYYTLEIHDNRDWLLLFSFLAIGITVGQIAGQVKAREREAKAKEKEAVTLYNASLSIGNRMNLKEAIESLAELLFDNIHPQGCVIIVRAQTGGKTHYDGLSVVKGSIGDVRIEDVIKIIDEKYADLKEEIKGYYSLNAENSSYPPEREPEEDFITPGGILRPIWTKRGVIGAIFVRFGADIKPSESTDRLIAAFTGLAGITTERYRFLEESLRSAAIHESERLKTVLFSSISHNLKNPLVSLTAVMSSLRQQDVALTPELINEHLLLMEEDIKRINENTDNLLNLAQLETGMWKPRKDWNELGEIISAALSALPEGEYKRIHVEFPEPLIMVWVDSIQITQVVRHLTENALEYSPPGSVVTISVNQEEDFIRLNVDDMGKGIPVNERENIFGKFFTRQPEKGRTGKRTGLGLIICREIIKAHAGSLRVTDAPSGGARFTVILPNAEPTGANK